MFNAKGFPSVFVGMLAIVAIGPVVPASAGSGHHHSHQVAQADKEPSIAAKALNDHLTLLYGVDGFTGGNVLVSSGEDGMLIIDTKLSTMTARLVEALDKLGGADALKFVINTHWHFDHVGSNETFGKDALIIAHGNVRKRLLSEQKIDAFEMTIAPQPKPALPVVTFDDRVSLHFNGEEIQLIHQPNSHTDTDSIVYFPASNVLHTGDLFFNGLFPFVDLQNGGDVRNLMKHVAGILDTYRADTVVVPGHGPLASMADLKQFHQMLSETVSHVEAMMQAGKSLDDIKAAGVPDAWKGWAWQLDEAAWNAIIHASLRR